MGPGQSLLNEIGITLSSDAITREALIRQLCNCAETQPGEDNTDPMFHSSLSIFSREFAVFIGSNNTQLMSDLCDWFDCNDTWKYTTKGQGEDNVLGVWVNIIGGTTPELLQSSLPRDAFGSGLMSRIIVVYAKERGKTVPIPFLTKEEKELRTKLLHDLSRIAIISGEFKMSQEAMEYWYDVRVHMDNHPPFDDYRMDGYCGRRPHHTLKLSMIMSVSESDSKIIQKSHIDRAISILDEAELHMLKAFSGVGKARLADTLLRVMSYIAVVKECTDDMLLRQFISDADNDDMQKIILTLYKTGAINITQTPGDRRRKITFVKQVV